MSVRNIYDTYIKKKYFKKEYIKKEYIKKELLKVKIVALTRHISETFKQT